LLELLQQLAAGDMVMVTPIERLASSTLDLLAIIKLIADAGALFRSLAEPWTDTGAITG
jgi:DNA invertase Pin-like site-specific DNA recombinase